MNTPKPRYPQAFALPVAQQLITLLTPHTEPGYLTIAGSLRRQRESVGDIEILFVPRLLTLDFRLETLDSPPDLAAAAINRLTDSALCTPHSAFLVRRPNKLGRDTWGPQNKLAIHVASGIPVDFFATTKEKWWMSLVIRTGPAELNERLAKGALRRGWKLHAYGDGFTDHRGHNVTCHSEEEVFTYSGLHYADPEFRI